MAATNRHRLRPTALGAAVLLAGALFLAWGFAIGVTSSAVLGLTLLATAGLDALAMSILRPLRRLPPLSRSLSPNPARAGQSVRVSLGARAALDPLPPAARGRADGLLASLEDSLPLPLVDGSASRRQRRRAGLPNRADKSSAWLLAADGPAAASAAGDYELPLTRRGIFSIGPARLSAVSPVGLWRASRTDATASELVVWPDGRQLSVPANESAGESCGGLGLPRPHLDDASLRDYVPGDDLHRVHWRSLARTGSLMTRAEEASAVRPALGVLRLELPQKLSSRRADQVGGLAETAISLIGSWGEALSRAGQSFDVDLNGQLLRQPTRAQLMKALAGLSVFTGSGGRRRGKGPNTNRPMRLTGLASPDGSPEPAERPPLDASLREASDLLLLLVTGQTTGSLRLPDPSDEGLAVVFAADELTVEASKAWQIVRLSPTADLAEAVQALDELWAARPLVGARR